MRYETASGKRTVLVSVATLKPADYRWSADGARVLLFTNTKKVWRQNTRGITPCSI